MRVPHVVFQVLHQVALYQVLLDTRWFKLYRRIDVDYMQILCFYIRNLISILGVL